MQTATSAANAVRASPPDRFSHPQRSSSSVEIIQHLLKVHHPALREHLRKFEILIHEVGPLENGAASHHRRMTYQFPRLKEELGNCMAHEKYIVFPQIERWHADGGLLTSSPPSEALLKAASELAQWHGKLLIQVWRLARHAGDLGQRAADIPVVRELQSSVSALCDDFYQQLFEEDCLLLPRITNWRRASKEQEGQPCPR